MSIKLEVWGDYALFTRPEMKAERVSYDIITPSAARGLIEAIYWHPGMRWIIDKIYVKNPIQFTHRSHSCLCPHPLYKPAAQRGQIHHLCTKCPHRHGTRNRRIVPLYFGGYSAAGSYASAGCTLCHRNALYNDRESLPWR